MKKLNDLFYSFLQVAASTQKLGINLIRISILIIFVDRRFEVLEL